MLADMYQIESIDPGKGNEIGHAIEKVQLEFMGSPGSLGQRLLRNLEDPGTFIAVSYWRDMESLANAIELHAAFDKPVGALSVRTARTAYKVVQELQGSTIKHRATSNVWFNHSITGRRDRDSVRSPLLRVLTSA